MRLISALFALCMLLGACTNPNDLDKKPAYLGNFHFGHNVVVAPNLTKGPASREASKEEWIDAMKLAMADRFDRYEGTRLYHLGISVDGYVLAIPGIPLVAAPKSALILNVTAWDDASASKLNEEAHTVTVVESFSGKTFLSSGLTQSKEKQMENLTRNAAKLIQNWLVQQNNKFGWFEDDGVPANEKRGILDSISNTAPKEDTTELAAADPTAAENAEAQETVTSGVETVTAEVNPDQPEALAAPADDTAQLINDVEAVLDDPIVEPELED